MNPFEFYALGLEFILFFNFIYFSYFNYLYLLAESRNTFIFAACILDLPVEGNICF